MSRRGMKLVFFLAVAVLAVCCTWASGASAQTYPSRAVRMVVPYTPGGPADGVARVLSESLSKRWGQPVVVENRPGAGGNIGTNDVAKANPDGYTLLLTQNGPLVINGALYENMPFNPIRDLQPISTVFWAPTVLIVPTLLPVSSVAEFIAYAKQRPGKLNFSSGGSGTLPHLVGELFNRRAGLDIVHIPYKGGPDMTAAVIVGDVAYNFNGLNILPLVQAGKIKALAVSSIKRTALAPELPTIAESGLPGFDVTSWGAVMAPAKTPQEIVSRLHDDLAEVLSDQDVKRRLEVFGVEPVSSTPEELAAQIRSESAHWQEVVKSAGVRLQ